MTREFGQCAVQWLPSGLTGGLHDDCDTLELSLDTLCRHRSTVLTLSYASNEEERGRRGSWPHYFNK